LVEIKAPATQAVMQEAIPPVMIQTILGTF